MKQGYRHEAPPEDEHDSSYIQRSAFDDEVDKKQEAEKTDDYDRSSNDMTSCLAQFESKRQ